MKKAIGHANCTECGHEVVVKENERGTLSYTCQYCDHAPHYQAGKMAHAHFLKKVRRFNSENSENEKPAPAPAAAPEKAEGKKTAPAKSAGLIL